MRDYSIGELARLGGTSVQTIRWYEARGLLPRAARTAGNRRRFDAEALRRLRFIRHARALGFTLTEIADLLSLADDPQAPCRDANAIAQRKLADVRRKIARLQALQDELERMIAQCPSETVRTCRVIEVLSDHGQCRHDEH